MPPVVAAWLVHGFTALGIVCALLATRATLAGSQEQAFFWLGAAFLIDGVDGALARRFRVFEHLPGFSGETLDLVIDYVTYVFVPALMLLQAGLIDGMSGIALAGLICMSSLYHFSDEGSKSADNCFVGFPAVWNLVAFYLFAFEPAAWITAAVILTGVALTFVRLKWVHPMRVAAWRPLTLAATALWGVAAAAGVQQGFPVEGWVKTVLAVVALYGIGLSLTMGRDDQGRRDF